MYNINIYSWYLWGHTQFELSASFSCKLVGILYIYIIIYNYFHHFIILDYITFILCFITISWPRINLSCFLFRATLTAWQPEKLLESYTNSLYISLFSGYASHVSHVSRPRQNSVFVGATTSHYLMPRPPRKTRSAMDLHSMVLDESAEQV